jgi:hypothetical protein
MITDGRTQGLRAAGFPVGGASRGVRGQVAISPVPATSKRACGSPAHGLPTSFTAGIRFLPPGLVGPGCDTVSIEADQAAVVRRAVGDHVEAEASALLVTLTDKDRQPSAPASDDELTKQVVNHSHEQPPIPTGRTGAAP